MPNDYLLLTTELDAVNLMLGAIGEAKVSTLEVATHEDASDALRLLRMASTTVQEQGWLFNVRNDVLLTRQLDGTIRRPSTALSIAPSDKSSDVSFALIEDKLLDLKANSYVWTKDVYATVTYLYPFEALPQVARNYIIQIAGMQFIGDNASASARAQFNEQRLRMAHQNMRRTQSLVRKPNMLTDSYHTAKAYLGRMPFSQ